MKKYLMLLLAALLLVCAMQIVQDQRELAAKLVRLHVVANSDSQTDQAVKLQVRDAVLDQVQDLTAGCADQAQTVAVLQEHLPLLQRTASETLARAGSGDTARVRLCRERFPTRLYPTFSLPAGEYTSLRVELGKAGGQNWWCVVFPTLCTAAQSQDMQAIAAASGFDDRQIAMICQTEEYEIDFKLLEVLEKVRELFAAP